MDHSRTKFLIVFAAATALFSLGCASGPAATNGKKTDTEGGPVQLKGAGATFPYLAYSKWLEGFKKDSKNVDISYKQTGSEDGIKQLEAGTIDFAGTDVPLTDEQISKFKVKPLHFPTLLGSVVPIYNVAGAGELKFTAAALAGIFSGKIKKWNDPALVKAHPGVSLPPPTIAVMHRA